MQFQQLIFDYYIAGPGLVNNEQKVIISLSINNVLQSFAILANNARRFADDILRAANEIDPLPDEEENENKNYDEKAIMLIIRSFNVNKCGVDIDKLCGGVLGGSVITGTLKNNDEIIDELNKPLYSINHDLTYSILQKLIVKTRNIIIKLYVQCENDFIIGLQLLEAIIEMQILETGKRQTSNLEKMIEITNIL